jgi:tetratricopeptide (TPR) repeat protein
VTRDDSTLARIARKAVTLEAPFYHLVRLARSRELAAWQSWAVHRFGASYAKALPVLSTGLWCRKFEAHIPSALTTLEALSQTLATQGFKSPGLLAKVQGRAAGEMIDEFERAIATPHPEAAGPFLDAALLQSYDRALFYTSLERIGSHLRESLSSTEATQWFSRAASPKGGSAVATAFHAWYLHLAEAKSGRANPEVLLADLAPNSPLGARPAIESYEDYQRHVGLGNPSIRTAVSRLAARLDTRPDQLWRLAAALRTDIGWLSFSETMHAAAANGSGHHEGRLLAFTATLRADWDSLNALLTGPLPLEERFQALAFVETAPGVDPATLDRAYRGFIAEAPRSWAMTGAYVTWLEKRGEYAKARAAIERWRAAPGRDSTGFDEIFSTTALARQYRREGKAGRGLEVIGDLDATYQFGAMAEKAHLLASLGRFDDAEKLATRALKRYPDHAGARTLCAAVAWRAGRYDQAAVVLTQGTNRLTPGDWAWTVAPTFADVFEGEPARAGQAVQALMGAGLRGVTTVGTLARPFADRGQPDQAFAIQSQIQVSGTQKFDIWIKGYVYLKAWRGEADALEWLKRKVPEDQRHVFSLFAHQEGCDELLWSFAPAVLDEEQKPYQLLLQAAALARNPSMPRFADFMTDLEVNRGNYYLKIARFLAGLMLEDEALDAARGKKARCEAYYFIGLKAEAEGRFRDAADWYSLSAETGAVGNGEYRWSMMRLFQLGGMQRALDTMKAERGPS